MQKESNAALLQQLEIAYEALGNAIALAKKNERLPISPPRKVHAVSGGATTKSVDFSIPLRAFVKKYSKGLTGSKKFTLLVAYLAKGDTNKSVSLAEVEKNWNNMTGKGLLGMKFNRFYSSDARENDWVNMAKKGAYHLRPSWKDIF